MKKLSLILALVFVGCMAMAQKTINIAQNGNNNVANLLQDDQVLGGLTANYITASQWGDGNILNSDQKGKANYIELTQGGNGNAAIMEQLGYDLNVETNTADVYQGGVGNFASLLQKENAVPTPSNFNHDINVANAQQTGTGGVYLLNQGTQTFVPTNYSELAQTGNNNAATINQTGQTSFSIIDQSGNGNRADLAQYGQSGMGASSWVNSISSQTGASNLLNVDQFTSETLATSNQNGVGNTTNIDQLSWDIEIVNATQNGTGDIINVTQLN
jgi:hypothetical protein